MELAYYILIPLLIVMAISFGFLAWFRIHRRSKRREQETGAVQDTSHMTDEEFQAHIGRESRRTRAAQRASRGLQQETTPQQQAFPEIEGYYAPEAPSGRVENGGDSEATRQLRGYYEPDTPQRPPPPTGGNGGRPVFG